MPDIVDPEAIKFVNETIRPLSESARALYYEIKAASVTWSNVSSKIPNTADLIEDGRGPEGVSRLTGQDVQILTSFFGSFISAYETSSEVAMVKPCVRSLNVS